MKIENPAVEATVIEDKDRYASLHVSYRIIASHQAAFAMDMAKGIAVGGSLVPDNPGQYQSTAAFQPPPFTAGQYQPFRQLTPYEIVDRSIAITHLLFEELAKRDWIIRAPATADLKRESPQQTGFVERE